ncbi:hypothetical protein EGR_10605 [Echinococcus granulosus]|uniref:Uncharacterized protein n=1 Tax=Echinococcus granulosus TaxID=6210 RepID=W6U813_ECHGR|nr:hypothetical protein EGR_10605 [Echinococcus granulosus]EUB54537.1 hypothetical protein EGR_10605 [Echinococcus granulosus]
MDILLRCVVASIDASAYVLGLGFVVNTVAVLQAAIAIAIGNA